MAVLLQRVKIEPITRDTYGLLSRNRLNSIKDAFFWVRRVSLLRYVKLVLFLCFSKDTFCDFK